MTNNTHSALTPLTGSCLKRLTCRLALIFSLPCFHAIRSQQSLTAMSSVPGECCTNGQCAFVDMINMRWHSKFQSNNGQSKNWSGGSRSQRCWQHSLQCGLEKLVGLPCHNNVGLVCLHRKHLSFDPHIQPPDHQICSCQSADIGAFLHSNTKASSGAMGAHLPEL